MDKKRTIRGLKSIPDPQWSSVISGMERTAYRKYQNSKGETSKMIAIFISLDRAVRIEEDFELPKTKKLVVPIMLPSKAIHLLPEDDIVESLARTRPKIVKRTYQVAVISSGYAILEEIQE